MFKSGGVITKDPNWEYFGPLDWNGIPQPGITQAFRWASYDAIYRRHLWVAVLVNKRAKATARLPLKVYQREDAGRPEARAHPYSELLRRPNTMVDPFSFWNWVSSTVDIYGLTYVGKIRDRAGRPKELVPMHPTLVTKDQRDDGRETYTWDNGRRRIEGIARRDLVIFRYYGDMSPLEPLRWTLENEEGARTANSALWRNGARPSVALKHPNKLSTDAGARLRASWDQIHTGAANFARTVVLEEGMEAQVLSFNSKELEYIDSRRLNREEACAIYDVPPPVVQILDRATFSNITEQMRSMYRDTMAPHLKMLESTLETELRDGRFGNARRTPDFGDDVYAEFLMDEVLRGSFEERTDSYQRGINAGWLKPSEVREKENLPPVPEADRLFINAAVVPIDQAGVEPGQEEAPPAPDPPAEPPARSAPSLPLTARTVRSVMARTGRATELAEVNPDVLVAGLPEGPILRWAYEQALEQGWTLTEFRHAVRASVVEDEPEAPQPPQVNVTLNQTVQTPDQTILVDPATVNVSTPDISAPVNVTVPERSVNVAVAKQDEPPRKRVVMRNDAGQITEIVETVGDQTRKSVVQRDEAGRIMEIVEE